MGSPDSTHAMSSASLPSWLLRFCFKPVILAISSWVILPSFPCQHFRYGGLSIASMP